MEQFPSSKELLNPKDERKVREKVINFAALKSGYSYAIPVTECNPNSMSTLCSRYGKVLGRKFKMYYHMQAGIIEIGRIDSIQTVQDKIDNL